MGATWVLASVSTCILQQKNHIIGESLNSSTVYEIKLGDRQRQISDNSPITSNLLYRHREYGNREMDWG